MSKTPSEKLKRRNVFNCCCDPYNSKGRSSGDKAGKRGDKKRAEREDFKHEERSEGDGYIG